MVGNSANINKTANNNFNTIEHKNNFTNINKTTNNKSNAKRGISPHQKFDPVTLTYDLENQ